MKRKIAALAAATATAALCALGATGTATAKTCSAGYVRATISGEKKCLHAGQRCKRRADRQYHRYGFHCHRKGRDDRYHLTKA